MTNLTSGNKIAILQNEITKCLFIFYLIKTTITRNTYY